MPTHRPVLLVVVCASIFFDALDLSITQVVLPSVQRNLGVTPAVLPWVAAAYVVTYGGVLLLGGRLTDVLGARRVLLAGLAVFGAASLACGLAPAASWVITARAAQGVGAALVGDVEAESDRGRCLDTAAGGEQVGRVRAAGHDPVRRQRSCQRRRRAALHRRRPDGCVQLCRRLDAARPAGAGADAYASRDPAPRRRHKLEPRRHRLYR